MRAFRRVTLIAAWAWATTIGVWVLGMLWPGHTPQPINTIMSYTTLATICVTGLWGFGLVVVGVRFLLEATSRAWR